ncbi:hypothetical protein G7Y89_g7762 [Cudoniella acicularis]|uniref:Uncharacterized protein n=1 Tax=Cudoniella acicularis TaxID=354080 RepID=A0A8H4RJG1_9HELO|nr:hypothetical protein G7Y89_g7762 [Cudoniella acicularis]
MTTLSSRGSSGFEHSNDQFLPIPNTLIPSHQSTHEMQLFENGDDGLESQEKASWSSLFTFAQRQHTFSVFAAVVFGILCGLPYPVAAIIYGRIFSDLANFGAGVSTGDEVLSSVSLWCASLAILGAGVWVIQGVCLTFEMIFGEQQAKAIRRKLFEGMLDKEMRWYDLRKDGIGSLLIRQTRELQLAVSQPFGLFITQVSGSLFALGVAFFYSWQLTLVIFATIPIAVAIIIWLSSGMGPAIEAQKRELTKASKYANTSFTAINIVKSFNGQEQEIWQYYTTIKEVAAKYMIQARANAVQFGITRFLMVGIFVQGFWFGLYLVQHGLNPGHVLTTFYCCLFSLQAIEITLSQWLVLKKGMSAGETLKTFMVAIQREGVVSTMTGSLRPNVCDGDIEINEVSFSYPSNSRQEVLKQSTFFFPANETTFVIGKSGSGKSTLGNLLMKYYTPTSGEIFIDGNSIQDLNSDWIRQNVTLVQQDSVLFNDTVFQNIAFGRHGQIKLEDVMKASQTADLLQTIIDLPDGLYTMVGSNGKSLSGGQQQRIALARARLRDSPIIILDESTSALDHTSRGKVMDEIRKWRKGKTTIIITHDVSQICDEDYVYVLDHGRVVQEGYRKTLAEKEHGTFFTFLKAGGNSPLDAEDENEEMSIERRRSEPFSPTTGLPDLSEDEFPIRHGPISEIFGFTRAVPNTLQRSPNVLGNNRFSLDFIAARTTFERQDAIWPTLSIPEEAVFKSQTPRRPKTLAPAAKDGKVDYTFRAGSPPPPSLSERGRGPGSLNLSFVPRENSNGSIRPKPILPAINTSIKPRHNPIVEEKQPVKDPPTNPLKEEKRMKPASLKTIFKSIWPALCGKDRVILILGFFATIATSASTPAFAYVFAQLLSTFYLTENQAAEGRKWALSLLGIAIVDGFCFFSMRYGFEHAGQAWVNALRVKAVKRILSQPKPWFDKPRNSPDRLTLCLDRNAEEMRNLLGRFAGPAFMVACMMTIGIVWALSINWRLTLVAFASAPVLFLAVRIFDRTSSIWEDKCNEADEKTSAMFSEAFSNIRIVRAFTLETYFKKKHSKSASETYRTGVSRAIYSGLCFGLKDAVSMFTTALVFYYATLLISHGGDTVNRIFQVINLLIFSIANSTAVISMIPQINTSRTTATQMLYLANLPYSPTSPSPSTPEPALQSSDLLVVANQQLPQSSPLSTHHDPSDPHKPPPLTFNGFSISDCNIASLRSFISIVPQAALLFPSSIYENITYGLPEGHPLATKDEAIHATTEAGIHDFIMSLEQGYNTVIGEGGMGLSGGQAQRICIARALIRRPKVLILDEATSALDAVNEAAIRETVAKIMGKSNRPGEKGMAVINISHKTEMMRIADEIVVVENGRIVERGGFEELRRRDGPFAKLLGLKIRITPSSAAGSFVNPFAREERLMTPVRPRDKRGWVRKTSL